MEANPCLWKSYIITTCCDGPVIPVTVTLNVPVHGALLIIIINNYCLLLFVFTYEFWYSTMGMARLTVGGKWKLTLMPPLNEHVAGVGKYLIWSYSVAEYLLQVNIIFFFFLFFSSFLPFPLLSFFSFLYSFFLGYALILIYPDDVWENKEPASKYNFTGFPATLDASLISYFYHL